MRVWIVVSVLAALAVCGRAQAPVIYGKDGDVFLPNLGVTPGVSRLSDVGVICATHWGKDVRHVTPKMKSNVCRGYGITMGCPGKGYEIDHLISRELGGADDEKNLWPQPAPQYHQKDVLENYLHKQVCADAMSLADAQNALVHDWWQAYQKMQADK